MTITIKDSNRDGKIQQSEWEAAVRGVDLNEDHEVYFNGAKVADAAKLNELQDQMKRRIVSSASNREIQEQAKQEVDNVQTRLSEALQALEQAKAEQNEERMEQIRESIRQMLQEYQAAATRAGISRGRQQSYMSSIRQASGVRENSSNFKASTTGGNSGAAQTSRNANAQTTSNAAGTGFAPPSNWGAQSAMPSNFNASAAYLSSMALEDSVMSSWDNIHKNQNKGKQLMMLFFYFARMAQSGDMGAMYQFMKFLTYIISKDKAKQQIEMGKKLIQLQDLSRKWTNKLLDLETNSTDPSASNELMKTMTIVKSETDAIATSQKLISQMMEEFAQVVESLTNSTKAALDAYGRILRTVSSAR